MESIRTSGPPAWEVLMTSILFGNSIFILEKIYYTLESAILAFHERQSIVFKVFISFK